MNAFSRACERLCIRFHVSDVSKATSSGESEVKVRKVASHVDGASRARFRQKRQDYATFSSALTVVASDERDVSPHQHCALLRPWL
jgi:hypothetical protein